MATQVAGTSVRATVVVEAPIEHAFIVFTEQMGTWWPKEHHLIEGELAEMVFEPRVGGNIYDREVSGRETHWARVLAYEPPNRLVFSWDLNNQFQIETDTTKTSEVEVTFVADGLKRTNVMLEHRNLDRHGEGWEANRDALASPEGWPLELNAFAKAAAA
jgi:uncharacterized protein YndB with AHSA1/START domain